MPERPPAGKESPGQKWPWSGPWPRGEELQRIRSGQAADKPAPKRRWRERLPRWDRTLLVVIVLAAVGAAVASVLIQRESDSDSDGGSAVEAPADIRKRIAAMPPEQKADAVLALGFTDGPTAVKQAGRAQLGGFFVGPAGWPGAGPGRRLLAQIAAAGGSGGRVPPLLITRQEGGPYNALSDLPPAQRQIELTTPPAARAAAAETAGALRAAGFHLNLAPVADVATLDSPVADRAFGDDDELVAALTAAALDGCAEGRLGCAPSHFPGLGGASHDPVEGPAVVSLDAASLEGRDLFPFEVAFKKKAPAVVLSLASYPAYDPVTPAALSEEVIGGVLRGQYGFEGVAITDDLSSGAITAGIGVAPAAVDALEAGADLILVSDPVDAAQARQGLAAAVKAGEIPPERVDEAVARVLILKRRLGLLPATRGNQGRRSQQRPQKGS